MRNSRTKRKTDTNSRPLSLALWTISELANPVAVAILGLAISAILFGLYVGKEVAIPIELAIVL
jgi:hypothetical protein